MNGIGRRVNVTFQSRRRRGGEGKRSTVEKVSSRQRRRRRRRRFPFNAISCHLHLDNLQLYICMYVCKIEGGWRIPVWAFIVRAAYTRWPLTKRLPVTPLLAARFLFIDLFSRRRAPMFAPLFFFLFLFLSLFSLVEGSKVNLTTISRFSRIHAIFQFFRLSVWEQVPVRTWNSALLLIRQKSSLHERIC